MNKRFVGGILDYTKKERRGIFTVLAFVACLYAAQYVYPLVVKPDKVPAAEIAVAVAALDSKASDLADKRVFDSKFPARNSFRSSSRYSPRTIETFYFDPNTATVQEWVRLGVSEKTAAGIEKYVGKGGRFREANDLKKIWGISERDKERLLPYVRIAETFSAAKPAYAAYERKPYVPKVVSPVDINTADSSAFEELPGIGAGYARRIVKFRESLGGFHHAEQVKETFGLPDSVFQKIKPYLNISTEPVVQLNINTATAEELKSHPYIRWQLANVICNYRQQHGNFKAVADLQNIMIINRETYERIAPYLKL